MNKLIKNWQERKKLDCVRFFEEFEDLILQQESDVLWTFLGVSSPNITRRVFTLNHKIKHKRFPIKQKRESEKLKKMKVVVDKKCYRSILNYIPAKQAIERT